MSSVKILIILILLLSATPCCADLIFDTGYNIFDDSYPYYPEVWVINNAVLDVVGGSMGKLELTDHAIGNIYRGEILHKLATIDNTIVNIYDGKFDMLASGNDSVAYLYAYDVTYYPTGGLADCGWIEGIYYSNDAPFSFSFYTSASYTHLQVVPEPSMILLLGFGCLFLRK